MRKFSPVLCLPLLVLAAQGASFTNGQAARAVIGQITFTDAYEVPLNGNVQPARPDILGAAGGLVYSKNTGTLYVADSNVIGATPINNRVLGFSTSQIPDWHADVAKAVQPSPICGLCGYPASVVIGQQDFTTTVSGRNAVPSNSAGSLSNPTAVATDGQTLAVADTNNNRILIWNPLPPNQTTPPNVVLGQASFTAFAGSQAVTASSLRGPQGVWIQNGKLFVADTQNNRVLIWNTIPTQNNQAADLVLGQPNFGTANQPSPGPAAYPTTAANQLLNPASVTSDGTHLFVTDLGFNRVLIWNSIPAGMDQGADVVVGQPDMTTSVPNWNTQLCGSNAVSASNQRLPCAKTLSFPRFALSDGTRLFIADGGNDRVLIFNQIPTANGAAADTVLGQPDFTSDIVSYQGSSFASTVIDNTSSVDTTPSPTSLAFDGVNLYVSDPYNRRVLVFTPGDVSLPANSVVNWASEIVRQEAVVTFSLTSGGSITANDTVSLTINNSTTPYKYTVQKNDTLDTIAQGLVSQVNANGGDANVTAIFSGAGTGSLYLSSKGINLANDSIQYSATVSNAANLQVSSSAAPTPGSTSGGYLTAGNAATAAPGMLIEINGANLTDQTASIDLATYTGNLPTTRGLAGVQVYVDGIAAPVIKVSPTQIVSEIPFSVDNVPLSNRNSSSIYVRAQRSNGSITVTNATPAYIAPANPGLFDVPQSTPRPWPATGVLHQIGYPSAVVSIDGTVKAGDIATITVNNVGYSYTVQSSDTLGSIVNGLVSKIKADSSAPVTAAPGGAFTRVVLTAIAGGAAGTGIPIAGSTSSGASVTVTAYTSSTCCNVTPNSPITADNPAVAGETIQVAAAGLGLFSDFNAVVAGQSYTGSETVSVVNTVSATMNGSTAQVVNAGLKKGSYGIYTVQLIVPSGTPTSNAVQLYIAQNAFVSNIVTLPVGAAAGPLPTPTPAPVCTFSLSSTALTFSASANTGIVGVIAPSGCAWSASSNASWLTVSSGSSGTGNGTVTFQMAANTGANAQTGTLTVANQTVTVTQAGTSTPLPAALRFVPVPPCRVTDTRGADAPIVSGGSTRNFSVTASPCNIPSTAQAYALNVTVVPAGQLSYLTVWQNGVTQPPVSTLNSFDGRIKANAAIVPAGTNGAVSVFATNDTHVILDINGYFVPATNTSALAYFPLPPCRVADTRGSSSPLGAKQARSFPVVSSNCNVPAAAQAYALNLTAIPKGTLSYLTVWPDGQTQPGVSTLNAPTGAVTANAVIVPASSNGNIDVYASDSTDVIIDINGYFAPPATTTGGLSLYNLPSCRAFDTRTEGGQPVQGTTAVNIAQSGCGVPTSNVGAYVLNATVVPQGSLSFLTLWSPDQSQPGVSTVSTLNAYDGAVTSNLALVPASAANSVNAFTTDSTHVILDLFGYFAP